MRITEQGFLLQKVRLLIDYDEWERTIPLAITGDTLWKMKVYRMALFAADSGWPDVTKLAQDRRTISLSDQLYRALGSISANIAEGYSRSSGKDQARFYEYALGSARESRDWYYKAHHVLGENIITSPRVVDPDHPSASDHRAISTCAASPRRISDLRS